MTDAARRYDRLATAFAAKVAGVPEDRWGAPTPCDDWTVRDLVRHVVESQATFAGLIGRELSAGPPVDEQPVDAFDSVRREIHGLLVDPATAEQTYEGAFGVRTFTWAVDNFVSFDLVVHGWDLARATGQDETIDLVELSRIRADAQGWGEAARAPGVFGPPLEAPPDADDQTRVLAFLGREA